MSLSTVSVSNLDLFHRWQEDDELDFAWLIARLRHEVPQTPAMLAGVAFHELLESVSPREIDYWTSGEYRFDFNCDYTLDLPQVREMTLEKQYGKLLVRGRVDGIRGKVITDYKTTEQFDAERYFDSYQWRFYLDMADCDRFIWHVFVLHEVDDKCYSVKEIHTLSQARYAGMHRDCEYVVEEYLDLAEREGLLQEVA